jgi:cyclase
MINKRIIFSLLYADGFFYLSRNFRLQKVGNIDWIKNNYGFGETCNFIDELIITFVKRNPTNEDYIKYFDDINRLRKKIFVPIILGGRIENFDNVKNCFLNGSDKVLINTLFYNDPNKITDFSNYYGKQAISLMIDYKIINEYNKKKFISYKNCGQEIGECISEEFIKKINNLPCGEVIFNSIDNDGNGSGINLELVKLLINLEKPLLLMGGAGKPEHISKTLKLEKVSGVVTANLFNFLGTGLKKAREECIADGIKLPIFEQEI